MQVLVKLKVGAQNAKMNQSFGPILGQNGINIKDFCDLFNKVSSKFFMNIPLNVFVVKISTKQFEILTIKIDRQFLINYFKEENTHKISIDNFYKIVYIYATINKLQLSEPKIILNIARQLYNSDPNLILCD